MFASQQFFSPQTKNKRCTVIPPDPPVACTGRVWLRETIPVSSSTICCILHRYGLTRKKIQQIALQRSDEFRADFKVEMDFFNIDQLVWLDKTGCDRRDYVRKMGYAMRDGLCHEG